MMGTEALRKRLEALEARDWNLPEIESRFNNLLRQGIPRKRLNPEEIISHKEEILNRVQQRGEEYCYLTRNCAKGSALAIFEEFGLGDMEMIRALTAFPGIGMTGGICGPVTGGVTSMNLYFSHEDLLNYQDIKANVAARKFVHRFEEAFGSLLCPKIQEFILGRYYDPMASLENYESFNNAKARQRCPLAPGIGARIAAEIIIENMEKNKTG